MRFIYLIFILIPLSLNAQEDFTQDVTWLDIHMEEGETEPPKILGQDEDYLYLLRYFRIDRENKYKIEKYDKRSLDLEKSTLFDLRWKDKELNIQDIFMLDGQPTIYSYYYDSQNSGVHCFLQVIDKTTMEPSEPILFVSQPISGFGVAAESIAGTAVNLALTKDKELAFTMRGKHGFIANEKNNELTCSVIDSELKTVNEVDVALPWDNFLSIKHELSDEGDFYILGYHYDEIGIDAILNKSLFNYSGNIYMVKINIVDGTTDIIEIEYKHDKIEMLSFELTKDGGFYVYGLTAKEDGGANGTIFMSFDKFNKEIRRTQLEFDSNFSDTKWKKHTIKGVISEDKSNPIYYGYELDRLIHNENGTYTLVAQQYRDNTYGQMTNPETPLPGALTGFSSVDPSWTYYFADILVINYDKNGNIIWKDAIDKLQLSLNYNGSESSYFLDEGNDKIMLLYNDYESNLVDLEKLSKKEKKAAEKNMITVQVTYDLEGNKTEKILYNQTGDVDIEINPRSSLSSNKYAPIFYGNKGRKVKIGFMINE